VAESSPFANVLHTDTIEKLARGSAVAQGRVYAASGRVKALTHAGGQLIAVVQGETFYAVSIWIRETGLGYICTCPAGGDGDFCKHCVAVAIAWLAKAPAK
jgi:uncharacterized Zn finger protein